MQSSPDVGQGSNASASFMSFTFHIESIRLFGYAAFITILVIGGLVTTYSGLETIPRPEDTVIYGIFQFNHAVRHDIEISINRFAPPHLLLLAVV